MKFSVMHALALFLSVFMQALALICLYYTKLHCNCQGEEREKNYFSMNPEDFFMIRSRFFLSFAPFPEFRSGLFCKPQARKTISIVAKIGTVKTPGFRMDIAKDKLLAIRVLSMFWLLQEPLKDQVFNVKYFCNNA